MNCVKIYLIKLLFGSLLFCDNIKVSILISPAGGILSGMSNKKLFRRFSGYPFIRSTVTILLLKIKKILGLYLID